MKRHFGPQSGLTYQNLIALRLENTPNFAADPIKNADMSVGQQASAMPLIAWIICILKLQSAYVKVL
jgi:hypothetical protein